MNHGEIWTVHGGQVVARVVVLSGDGHNADEPPLCAPLVRQRPGPLPRLGVALAETDPVTGVVLVSRVRPINRAAAQTCDGIVTGASLARLNEALRDLFEL